MNNTSGNANRVNNATRANANRTNANRTNTNTNRTNANANRTNTNTNRTNTNANRTNTNTNRTNTNTNRGNNNANRTNSNTNTNRGNNNANRGNNNANRGNNNANRGNNNSNNNSGNNENINENNLNELNKNNNNNNNNTNNNANNNTNNNNNKKKTIKNNLNKAKTIATGLVSKTVSTASNAVDTIRESSTLMTVVKVVLAVIVLLIVVHVAKRLYKSYKDYYLNSPYLLDGTKNAKHALVISQDPTSVNYIPIKRSEGRNGIEFTYSVWFVIEDFSYKKGEWKHLFHKGNASSYPNRGPGVWLHPDKNIVRVYMNTQNKILEYVDIDNIPTRKWVHLAIVLKNKILEIYVNGYMKSRKEFDSLPRQNKGDLWMNMFGGYEGYMSKLRYYNYAIEYQEIDKIVSQGPSSSSCIETGEEPPYLDDKWWF